MSDELKIEDDIKTIKNDIQEIKNGVKADKNLQTTYAVMLIIFGGLLCAFTPAIIAGGITLFIGITGL